jgi:hypothetical protein
MAKTTYEAEASAPNTSKPKMTIRRHSAARRSLVWPRLRVHHGQAPRGRGQAIGATFNELLRYRELIAGSCRGPPRGEIATIKTSIKWPADRAARDFYAGSQNVCSHPRLLIKPLTSRHSFPLAPKATRTRTCTAETDLDAHSASASNSRCNRYRLGRAVRAEFEHFANR